MKKKRYFWYPSNPFNYNSIKLRIHYRILDHIKSLWSSLAQIWFLFAPYSLYYHITDKVSFKVKSDTEYTRYHDQVHCLIKWSNHPCPIIIIKIILKFIFIRAGITTEVKARLTRLNLPRHVRRSQGLVTVMSNTTR